MKVKQLMHLNTSGKSFQFIRIPGIRARLASKDNNPKWIPSSIEDVTEQRVLSFFRPLSNNDDLNM